MGVRSLWVGRCGGHDIYSFLPRQSPVGAGKGAVGRYGRGFRFLGTGVRVTSEMKRSGVRRMGWAGAGLCLVGFLSACGGGGDVTSSTASPAAPTAVSASDQATSAPAAASDATSTSTSAAATPTTGVVQPPLVSTGKTACGDAQAGRAVAALLNAWRAQGASCAGVAQAPVAALRWDDRLAAAAARHAADSAAMGAVTHVGSDGSSVAQRVAEAGFSAWGVGENAAAGVSSAGAVLALWQDSPPHCVNMAAPEYTDVGVACASDARSPLGEHWVMVLGRAVGAP